MSGPHDLFVRFTFGQPQRAAAELKAALPSELVSEVDWATLRREPGSVVDAHLRESQSDLLFSARLRTGEPVLFYVLLEHQSSVDPWMALRMLSYVVRQLELWRKAHPQSPKLPVIIPLVLYHGPEGTWSAPLRVEELFALPDEEPQRGQLRARVPRFEYQVDDLTAQRVEALLRRPGPPLVRLAWLLLCCGRTGKLAEQLQGQAALFAQVQAEPEGWEELRVVVHYLLLVGDEAAREATASVLHWVMGTQRAEALMQTVGERLIEQGLQQGLARGRAEGRAEGQAEGLAEGLAKGRAEDVLRILSARGIHVDGKARQRILSCTDLTLLDQWFDRALKATHLSEVLGT